MDDQSASGRPTDERNVNDVADDVAKSVSETVGAILGVGVSVARLFARATAQPGMKSRLRRAKVRSRR
jgi:hypothetical protein